VTFKNQFCLLYKMASRPIHVIEFWHYLAGKKPEEIAVHIEPRKIITLSDDYPNLEHILLDVPEGIPGDVDATWQSALEANPQMTNNLKPVIRTISDDGTRYSAAMSSYKNSLWMKKRLSQYSEQIQQQIADILAFFNIGLVTMTSDGFVLLEQRPENVTAGGMLLNYPCGYLTATDTTLADPVNAQCIGELGFPAYVNGMLDPRIQCINSLGMQRESDEWTPNLVFLMKLNIPFAEVRPTKETKKIIGWPYDDIIERTAKAYSPTIKGAVSGKLVPNAIAMLALAVRHISGERAYQTLCCRLSQAAHVKGYNLIEREYAPSTNPFKQSS
jgi:hypothetical protein